MSCRRLVLALGMLAAATLNAQTLALAGSRWEVRGQERTVYSRERNAAPRWSKIYASLPVDSLVSTPSGSIAYARTSNPHLVADVRVWRSRPGSVDSVTAAMRELPQPSSVYPATEVELRNLSVETIRNDVANIFSTAILFTGASAHGIERFSIRVNFAADTFVRNMQGTVISRHLRDSVADGRTLRIVHDSVAFTENTATPLSERTLYAARVDIRRLAGITVGTRVYDVVRQLTIAVADTTRLSGTETRHLPDSRVLTDNVIYERMRTASLLDSVARRTLSESESAAFGIGMVIRPPLGARPVLDIRKPGVVDSLVALYRTTRVSAVRDSVLAVPNFVYIPGNRERIAHVHAEQGDTVGALRVLTLDYNTPLSEWAYNLVRPVLDNPQTAMRLGISSNELYEAFEYEFHHYPFSMAGGRTSGDSMQWCPRRVCAIVAQEWTRAGDSRLRNIGLMARYRMNPALYADTLIAAARAGAKQLMSLSEQAQGSTRARSDDPPVYMPAAGAGWRQWFVWMRGESDETHNRRTATNLERGISPPPGSPFNELLNSVRLTASPDLLRIAQLRTGVSFRDTFQSKYAEASIDTARYVYFTLLQSLGDSVPPRGDIVNRLTSASVFERKIALADVQGLKFIPADARVSREIEGAMLDVLLDSLPLWPQLDTTRRLQVPIRKFTRRSAVHVVADSLQPATVARLRAAGIDVQRAGWELPNEQSGEVVRLQPITQSGDFAVVPFETVWLTRLASGVGGGEATGGSCLLVWVGGKWFLVDAGFWMT